MPRKGVKDKHLSGLLALGAGSWLHDSLALALGCSRSLALASCTDRSTHGTRQIHTHQGLRPHRVGRSLLEAGSHAGMRASLGCSLWGTDPVQQGTQVLDCHMETESSAPRS